MRFSAKATMLVVAYAFYRNDEGSPDYSNIGEQFKYGGGGTVQGKTGSATFTDREDMELQILLIGENII